MNPRDEKLKKAAEQAQREWEQAIDATDAARMALERAKKAEREARKKAKKAFYNMTVQSFFKADISNRLNTVKLSRRSRN